MRVLMINGSPRPNGCTARALKEIEATLRAEGIETELIQIGRKPVRGCIACGACAERGACVFGDDGVNEAAGKFRQADGLIVEAHPDPINAFSDAPQQLETGKFQAFLDDLAPWIELARKERRRPEPA